MRTQVKALASILVVGILGGVGLTGCDRQPQPLKPATHSVPITTARGNELNVKVTEVCIQGVVYLMTETGGITAKFFSDTNSTASSAYVFSCK